MKQIISLLIILLVTIQTALAQHEHHTPPPKKQVTKAPKKVTAKPARPAQTKPPAATEHKHHTVPPQQPVADEEPEEDEAAHLHEDDEADSSTHTDHSAHGPGMSHILSLNLPMTRNGSGSGWNPDNSPMYMYMKHAGKWMYMLHGNVFIRYNKQDLSGKGSRGDEMWDVPNMLMAMAQRPIGKRGLFHFGAMFSADALFTGQRGYPLLFQSGESAHGEPLVDRQHPHDLFSALEVSYAHSFNKKMDAYIYLGYPGEPALGATTFMHRPSGWDNPDAPISHHWVDATHISFGVATLGLRYGKFKLEASSFTGREPDENRYDFDKPRFDSRSARLWFNPSPALAFQVSHGFLRSPEALHDDHDVYRTTASGTYSRRFGKERFFNATALWAMNKEKRHDGERAALLEAALRMQRLVVYSRFEWVEKSVTELHLDESVYGHDRIFPVNAFTLGAGYDILHNTAVRASLGAQTSFYHTDKVLDPLYGRNPMAAEVYLRFYPNLMKGI